MLNDEKAATFTISNPLEGARSLDDDGKPSRHFDALGNGHRFTKVACKEKGVHLEIEEIIDENNSKDVTLKSADQPHEDFTKAVKMLVPLVRHILAFPDGYAPHSLNIGSVSFSFDKNENKGIVISGWINLDTANSPFFFNTPYMPYERPSEQSSAPVVPDFGVAALNAVETEAAAYLKGKRAQLSLDLD
jgi:hypothetical protein